MIEPQHRPLCRTEAPAPAHSQAAGPRAHAAQVFGSRGAWEAYESSALAEGAGSGLPQGHAPAGFAAYAALEFPFR